MSDNASNFTESVIEEASRIVRAAAGERRAGDSVKACLNRAARKLNWLSASRVKDLWYADPRICVSAEEITKLRNIGPGVEQKEDPIDIVEITQRLTRIEALLCENARKRRYLYRQTSNYRLHLCAKGHSPLAR